MPDLNNDINMRARGGLGRNKDQERLQGRGLKGEARPGSGPSGFCLCPNCGNRIPHQIGKPCLEMVCPKCGTQMTRE